MEPHSVRAWPKKNDFDAGTGNQFPAKLPVTGAGDRLNYPQNLTAY